MRALATALTAGILATASVPASAATEKLDFTMYVSGGANREYFSSSYVLFDPRLGTLTEVSQTISGSLTWTPGADPAELTLFSRRLGETSSQTFMSSSSKDPRVIDVDLNSEASDTETLSTFTGVGAIVSFFEARETPRRPPGGLSGVLSGFVTYDYTPATPAVPEPATWAMMLLGFAGLGYAAVRRRGARRPIPSKPNEKGAAQP